MKTTTPQPTEIEIEAIALAKQESRLGGYNVHSQGYEAAHRQYMTACFTFEEKWKVTDWTPIYNQWIARSA